MTGLQKSGYLEVKQPSNIKGRKLKTWRKRWVVAHKMSNLSSGSFAAKMDLYPDEESAKSTSHDRQTFIFENVTEIKSSQSKTHKLAFEILETEPVLVLSGQNQVDTEAWITILQNIFWPRKEVEGEDCFKVFVIESEDSSKHSLYGQYYMTVSPEKVKIKAMSRSHEMEWNLGYLKRFYLDKDNSSTLIIESGSKSRCGEAKFKFSSMNVQDILKSIRNNIKVAISLRQTPVEEERNRSSSTSDSEKGFKVLLENSDRPRTRTISEGSDLISEKITPVPNSTDVPRQRKISMVLPPYTPPNIDQSCENSTNDRGKTTKHSENRESQHSDHEYSVLNQKDAGSGHITNEPRIISTIRVDDGNNREGIFIGYDSKGYSHIKTVKSGESPSSDKTFPEKTCETNSTPHEFGLDKALDNENKIRSVSEYSANSVDFRRSSSISSRDSGVVCASPDVKTDSFEPVAESIICKHHSSNSFDSAISTSSTISASVKEAFLVTSKPCPSDINTQSHAVGPITTHSQDSLKGHEIYCDIDQMRKISFQEDKKESEYEELDKYKKDINKFLGIESKVKPDDVPPSLPERPSSLIVKRREIPSPKSVQDKASRKISLPLLIMKPKGKKQKPSKIRSSTLTQVSTSSSDSDEEDKSSVCVTNVKNWPLEKDSTASKNVLYESVSSPYCEKEVRERSGSGSFRLKQVTRPRRPSDSTILDNVVTKKTPTLSKGDAYTEIKQIQAEQNQTANESIKQVESIPAEEILIPGLDSPKTATSLSDSNLKSNQSSNSVCDSKSSISEHSTSNSSSCSPQTPRSKQSSDGDLCSEKLTESLIKFDEEIDLFHMGIFREEHTPDLSFSTSEPFSSDLESVWNPFPELGEVKSIRKTLPNDTSLHENSNINQNTNQKNLLEFSEDSVFDPFNLGLHSATDILPTPKKNSSNSGDVPDVLNSKLIDISDDAESDAYMDMSGLKSEETVEYVEADFIRLG